MAWLGLGGLAGLDAFSWACGPGRFQGLGLQGGLRIVRLKPDSGELRMSLGWALTWFRIGLGPYS